MGEENTKTVIQDTAAIAKSAINQKTQTGLQLLPNLSANKWFNQSGVYSAKSGFMKIN